MKRLRLYAHNTDTESKALVAAAEAEINKKLSEVMDYALKYNIDVYFQDPSGWNSQCKLVLGPTETEYGSGPGRSRGEWMSSDEKC